MEIAVNARLLLSNKLEGIGRFTWESLRRICQAHPEHNFHFFFDRQYDPQFLPLDNMIPHVIGPQARHPILFKIWFNRSVTKQLEKISADLFLSTDGYLSLKTSVPQLAVIHDLNFEYRPQDLRKRDAAYYLEFFPKFAKKASRIATVSQYSKFDLERLYRVPADKIDVVYNGVSAEFVYDEKLNTQEVKDQYSKGKDYLLFVGSLHPRKNLKTLIKAYEMLGAERHENLSLLIVGAKMWDKKFLEEEASGLPGIHFTGRISDLELAKVYQAASLFVFPSFFEGFGIPLIEAMSCGCPVISAYRTSIPEIAADASLYFNPESEEEIKQQIIRILDDPILTDGLREKGFLQAKKFSWDRTADLLWESMQKCLPS